MSNRKIFFKLKSVNNYVGDEVIFEYTVWLEGYSTSRFLSVDIKIQNKHLFQIYDVTGQVDALQKCYQISRDLGLSISDFVLNPKEGV